MYYETTQEIEVSVEPFYLEEQSDPDEGRFVFAYHVRIQNQSVRTVQLINRFWKITDGFGRIQEVRGPGVVGEQPVLEPGEMFEYTSGCPLTTPTGIMAGTYEMETTNGDRFNVKIPAFSLDSPNVRTHIN
ncbi:MAG: Co2+/Mg2+ efflux protein ApaG [Rhodospirillaceae bacterium]|nr:Co2+/Mg2+ efflux protein ApaG [Alphaproteobacteria bacterium]MBR71559.1 Co2+/Mg2+ efflux protein ApaG [Rhodospirillaceae bacterium]|tara:strand:+ start:2356 stop:2748 length:393 start_codon:yes stop_codon:yes gene_type:complete